MREEKTIMAKDIDRQELAVAKLCHAVEEGQPWKDLLWECITLFQNVSFTTSGRGSRPGIEFTYQLKISNRTGKTTDEMIVDRKENSKSITRSTVELGFANALVEQAAMGFVKGPKKLKVFGSSYLYVIFLKWGVICNSCQKTLDDYVDNFSQK